MKTIETAEDFMNYWVPVYEDFLTWHGDYRGKVIDYYPNGRNELVLRLIDGTAIKFDWTTNRIRPVRPSDFEERNTDEAWKKGFSERLFRRMRKTLITQDELSRRTGISQVTISNYVKAKVMPSAANITRLAYALNCSVLELMED